MNAAPGSGPDPSAIMQIGMGFMASKTLLSAIELELFTALADHPMTGAQIGDRFGLHPRGLYDFLDALVALGMLGRDGEGHEATYANTEVTGVFLDKNKPSYIGGILEMANHRLYPYWANLTEALHTGKPQNELKDGNVDNPFDVIYQDQEKLEEFLRAMSGVQMGNFMALSAKFDFSGYQTFCDVGGASGALAIQIAKTHEHLTCMTMDLPPVGPVARRHVEAAGLGDRVQIIDGNFFEDELPKADVITMGNILHDWDEAQKKALIQKAYDALPDGGAFVAIEFVIDDARRENTFGLLMSLNMLVETPGGFDYTPSQFDGWCKAVGFKSTEVMPLAGPASAAIARK